MIRLDATTRKLQIILGGAVTTNQLPVTVCYSDKTSVTYIGGAQVAVTNGGTAVDICAAPAASTVRDIDCIDVQNADTVNAVATIRINDNGTLYTLFKSTLTTGDQLTYTHGQGWKVLDASGAVKSLSSDVVTLTGTQTLSNKTVSGLIDSGGLDFTGTGNRITGDFSNATVINRVMVQTNLTNGNSAFSVLPNGTSRVASFHAYNTSDPTNSSRLNFATTVSAVLLSSDVTGSGTFLPFEFFTSNNEQVRFAIDGTCTLGGAVTTPALKIIPVASQTRYVTVTGSNGSDPIIGTSAGNLQCSSVLMPIQAATGSAPTYIKGGLYFDTTLNKLRVGGATQWETVTSV